MNFNDLGYRVGNGVVSDLTSRGMEYLRTGGKGEAVKFYRYDMGGSILSVLAKKVINEIKNMAADSLRSLYQNWINKKKIAGLTDDSGYTQLILNSYSVKERNKDNGYGVMSINGNSRQVIATDVYGNRCVDAFMMGIPLKTPIKMEAFTENSFTELQETGFGIEKKPATERIDRFESDTLVWWDCTAIVNVNSTRNVVITPVQGRDYSRKELVSNGDINFTVTGKILSNLPDVYPEEEVKKFIQIMKYKGIVTINSQALDMFGITQMIVKDFSLPQKEGGKSQQEYSFNAVGIMPAEETKITNDTLTVINQTFTTLEEEKQKNGWQKLLDSVVDSAKQAGSDAIEGGISMVNGILDNGFKF